MGVDLTLLPFDADMDNLHFSHTVLSCERRSELFDAIQEIESQHGHPVPDNFTSYLGIHGKHCSEHGYGLTIETPYGQPLQAVSRERLLTLCTHDGVIGNTKNRAIWAYIALLLPYTKITLYWH